MLHRVSAVLSRLIPILLIVAGSVWFVEKGEVSLGNPMGAAYTADMEIRLAVQNDDPETLALLLDQAEERQDEVRVSMLTASASGSIRVLRLLAEMDAPFDEPDPATGLSALHYAVIGASPDSVKFLLDRGCRTSIRSRLSGRTPLDLALHRLDNPMFESDWPGISRCVELLRAG